MYKKTLINLAAITTAMSLAFGPAVTTLAADGGVVVTGDISVTNDSSNPDDAVPQDDANVIKYEANGEDRYYRAVDGQKIIIEGDVTSTAEENSTVYAENSSTATVNGDVHSENFRGINAQSGSTITVNGDITSDYKGIVNDYSTEVVNGDVTAAYVGIDANGKADITVNGNVTATGYDKSTDTKMGNSDVHEYPELRNSGMDGIGITTFGTDDIYVDGNVTGYMDGLLVNPIASTTPTGSIVITGTLSSELARVDTNKYNGIDYASKEERNKFGSEGDDAATIASAIYDRLPDVTVYAMDNAAYSISYALADDVTTATYSDVHTELNKIIDQKTHYIIKMDEASKSLYDIQGGYDLNDKYNLMTMTTTSVLKVAVAEGYELNGGENVTIVANEDGTFSVTLNNLKGGVTISARLRAVSVPATNYDAPNEVSYNAGVVTNDEVSSETSVDEPFIFATVTISKGLSDLPEVLGASLEDGTSNEVVVPKQVIKIASGSLTAIQYKRAFIDSCKTAPANSIIRLETAKASCFDKMMIEALAARPDLTLEVAFPLEGENVDLTVPAGYDVMSLLDTNGYCGFLYLNHLFRH